MAGIIERNVGNLHDQDTGLLVGYRNPVTGREAALQAGLTIVNGSTRAADATATTNAIRAALADGGALVTGGDVYVNSTIYVDEGQSLVTAPGTKLLLAPNAAVLMLGTAPMNDSWTTVTVTWTADAVATVNWPGHNRTPGSGLILQGAAEKDWNTVYRVTAVSGNNITVAVPFFASAGPTGTITAKRLIRLGKIDVELDYDMANNPPAAGPYDRHGSYMAFLIDSLDLDIRVSNTQKYGSSLSGSLNCDLRVNGYNVAEICKKYGPLRDCTTRPSGMARDDCATFQAKEPDLYIAYMPCFGPIRDCREFPGECVNSGGPATGALVIYTDEENTIDGIVYEGGTAHGTVSRGFSINNGAGFNAALAKVGRVTVNDLTMTGRSVTAGLNYCAVIDTNVDVLTFNRPRFIPTELSREVLRFPDANCLVKILIVEGWRFDESLWPASGAASYLFNLSTKFNHIILRNCTLRGRSTQARWLNLGVAGIKRLTLERCNLSDMSQIGLLNSSAAGTTVIEMDGVYAENVATGFDVRSACKVIVRNSTFVNMTNGVVRPTTNAVSVEVIDQGGNTFTNSPPITCVAPGTAIPYGAFPIDIGATGITKAAGASAFNTGTGRGTVPQNRQVACNGVAWSAVSGGVMGPATFTAGITAAASATLTAAFAGTTGTYLLTFSEGSERLTTLTNGSTAVSWTGNVTASAQATYEAAF